MRGLLPRHPGEQGRRLLAVALMERYPVMADLGLDQIDRAIASRPLHQVTQQ
jgi:hypothetical protein